MAGNNISKNNKKACLVKMVDLYSREFYHNVIFLAKKRVDE